MENLLIISYWLLGYIIGAICTWIVFKRFAIGPIGTDETELYESVLTSLMICSWLGLLIFLLTDLVCWIRTKLQRKVSNESYNRMHKEIQKNNIAYHDI